MKLDHIVLLSSDLAKSSKHYDIILGHLGFKKSRDWVWVNSEGFAIDLRSAEGSQGYERYAPGLNHLAFSTETQIEFERLISDLTSAGISVPPVQKFEDGSAVFIQDPDVLRIEIACGSAENG